MYLPPFLSDLYVFKCYKLVSINQFYVGLYDIEGRVVKYVPVIETPHYMFVKSIITNSNEQSIYDFRDYEHYRTICPSACSVKKFIELIESIKSNGYDSDNKPILVFRTLRRPYPLVRWDVADGFHRLAILAALGESSIRVATLRTKKPMINKVIDRLLPSVQNNNE